MTISGSTQYAQIRYRTTRCGTCGKTFECPTCTLYKTGSGSNLQYYCSYGCFRDATREAVERAHEIEEERAAREIYLEALRKRRVYLRHRLEQTREKVAFYTAQRAEHKKGTPEWDSANELLVKWREKRKQANQDLDDLALKRRQRTE